MLRKYSVSVGLAATTTAALLGLMQFLIYSGKGGTDVQARPIEIEMVQVREETKPIKKKKPPIKPKVVKAPPPPPTEDNPEIPNHPLSTAVPHGPIAPPVLQSHPGPMADGDILPLTKVQPIYPRRAQERGIEGHVIVEFIVTATGSVRNVEVVESTSSLLNDSAVDAARKFKYKPRVINGIPVEVSGVQNIITFSLVD